MLTGASIRVGVVGYGAIGKHHARNLQALAAADVVGIADEDSQTRKDAARAGFRTFRDLDSLLSAGVDAVILSVPTALHKSLALQALSAGCAVLVEKPIALTSADGREIIDVARKKRLPLMVGYVERYNPAVIALREFMKTGHLGKIHGISARRIGTMPARIRDANVLIDIGVHDVDMAAFILDCDLTLKSAQGGRAFLEDRLDFAFMALSGNGVPIHIESNWITPVKFREVFVTGENGLCHVDYITQTARFAAGRRFVEMDTFEGTVEQYVAGEFVDIPVKKEEPLRRQLEIFLNGVRGAELPDSVLSLTSLRIAEEATEQIEAAMLRGVAVA